MNETARLVGALDRCRDRIHALPGVVGTGVGLHEGEPAVEVYVAGEPEPGLERAIRDLADFDFVVVPHSEPAEAQVEHRDREE